MEHRKNSPQRAHWTVPFGRNEDFIGREDIISQLLERIPPRNIEGDCQQTAIAGLGGVGKTQIALECAFRVRHNHPDCSVFWVSAVDAMTFENAYREIGRRLGIVGIDEDKADVKAIVKAGLSRDNAGSWFLIVDNADDPELLFGNSGEMALYDCFPFSRLGSILLTTRNHEVAVRLDIQERNVIETAEMSSAEAIRLLQGSLREHQTHDNASTRSLLGLLANLPLAIRQASAYMARTEMTTTTYLEHCLSIDRSMIKLLSDGFKDRYRYEGIRNPVATTWLISFEHISQHNPLASQYLKSMCFYATKEIPVSLLLSADNKLEADKAIGILKAYAFVTQREGQDSFDIHGLVRLAMRNWLRLRGEREKCATDVIRGLVKVFPYPQHDNRDVWTKFVAHAQSVLEFREDSKDQEAGLALFSRVARSSFLLGKYKDSETMYRQTLELCEKVLGREHSDTLDSMYNLANVLDSQGKYEEAEIIYRQTLELMEKVLGREHPDTLGTTNNLALTLNSQGKYKAAETMHRQTLELMEKVLGREHPNTLFSMSNLLNVLKSQGKYKEVEIMHRQILELKEKVLGREHPDTLDSMYNLANMLDSQGKYKEAEIMHWQTLELMEKVLGREYPDTLDSMNNLANVLDSQGKYKEAEIMHRQTLKLREKVLGREHPDTLSSMNNLANELGSQGKYKEAEIIYRQTLELKEKVLGRESPDTLGCMYNLASILDSQGKYKEAKIMHRQTLKLKEKVLGREHPDTLDSMNNLANLLDSQGKYKEAKIMHRQTLKLREKVLGREHPDTLSSMNNLANVLDSQGKYKEAKIMHRQTLKLREKVLGREHPDTLDSINNLANVLDSQGRNIEATALREEYFRATL